MRTLLILLAGTFGVLGHKIPRGLFWAMLSISLPAEAISGAFFVFVWHLLLDYASIIGSQSDLLMHMCPRDHALTANVSHGDRSVRKTNKTCGRRLHMAIKHTQQHTYLIARPQNEAHWGVVKKYICLIYSEKLTSPSVRNTSARELLCMNTLSASRALSGTPSVSASLATTWNTINTSRTHQRARN